MRSLLLLLFLGASGATPAHFYKRISEGHNCKDRMKHHVALCAGECSNFHVSCGGTLIRKNWVLTAAHCNENLEDKKKYVLIPADNDLSKGGEKIEIKKMLHAGFDRERFEEDIMLVQLTEDAKIDIAVSLPTVSDCKKLSELKECLLTGWGRHTFLSNKGKKVEPPYDLGCLHLKNDNCDHYKKTKLIPVVDNLCVTGEESGVHHGDSGGGLICGKKIYGVVSRGEVPPSKDPIYFTSVCFHLDWINGMIK